MTKPFLGIGVILAKFQMSGNILEEKDILRRWRNGVTSAIAQRFVPIGENPYSSAGLRILRSETKKYG